MALPAGRKGVLPSELTPEGKIKKSGSQYVLPIANANTLGGVKAVSKTEAMTKEVGIDSEGKLYVEPSQGGGAEIGTAILASGLTGFITYVKIGDLCYVSGEVEGLDSGTYTTVDLCTGLPYLGANGCRFPIIVATSGYTGSDLIAASLIMSDTTIKLGARYKGFSSSKKYTFSGVYICGEFTLSKLTMQNVEANDVYAGVCGDYAVIEGNFIASSGTADVAFDVCSVVPDIDTAILTSFISDGICCVNYNTVYVDGSVLKVILPNNSYRWMDGAMVYKIDKGGN